MPNWCNNSITIQGPIETIKTLWTDAQEADGLLTAMVPQPEDMFHGNLGEAERKECEEKGIPNWYDWNVANWGTKWDVSLEGLEFIDNGDGTAYISGWFDSAWAPPIDAYEHFADMMDNCSIEASYYEPGMNFGGFWSTEHGDECFEDIDGLLKQPTEEWDERFTAFEAEYDLLSEEWRFEDEEEELIDEA